jgi:hypothetical protein
MVRTLCPRFTSDLLHASASPSPRGSRLACTLDLLRPIYSSLSFPSIHDIPFSRRSLFHYQLGTPHHFLIRLSARKPYSHQRGCIVEWPRTTTISLCVHSLLSPADTQMAHRRSRSGHRQMILPRQVCQCQLRPRKASPLADVLHPSPIRLKNSRRYPADRDAGTTTNIPFHATFSRSSSRVQRSPEM